MPRPDSMSTTRRALLRHLATTAAVAAGLPLLGRAATPPAKEDAGKVAKSALQYRDTPQGSSACASCVHFLPGESADAPGRCKIVAGEISPQGWCLAYTAKG